MPSSPCVHLRVPFLGHVMVVLLVLLVAGCASSPSREKAAKEVALGAAMACVYLFVFPPLGLACVPIAAAAGAGMAAVGQAAIENIRASRQPASGPDPITRPRWVDMRHVGRIDVGDALPAGELYVAELWAEWQPADKSERWLIVDFDNPSEKGEWSYAASTTADCSAETLALSYSMTYLDKLGHGEQIGYRLHTPQLLIEKPTGSLASAVRNICGLATAQEAPTRD